MADDYLTVEEAKREIRSRIWHLQQSIASSKKQIEQDPELRPVRGVVGRLLDDLSYDLGLLADMDPREGGYQRRFEEVRDQLRVLGDPALTPKD